MMKQKLLATTALVSLVAGSAFAGGPAPSMHNDMSVKIGGQYDAKLIFRDLKNKGLTRLTANNKNFALDTEARIFVEAKNSTAKGLEYGAHIGLGAQTVSSSNPNSALNRSWLWMEHADMGRVELGSNNDVSESMRIGADRVATATGGISGDWFKILNTEVFGVASTASFAEFNLTPWNVGDNALDFETLTNNAIQEKARKINYYSPKMNGFQIGLSYTPDSANLGSASSLPRVAAAGAAAAGAHNVVSAGLAWEGTMGNDIATSLSAVMMQGKVRNDTNGIQSNKISAFDIGGMMSHKKMKGAVSIGRTGKTGFQRPIANISKGYYATAGASYEFDKVVTSLTYIYGKKSKNKSHVFSLGADYHLAAGIMPYAELTHFDAKLTNTGGLLDSVAGGAGTSTAATITAAAETNNKASGTAFIMGTKLSF